jgi:hypothetical protein
MIAAAGAALNAIMFDGQMRPPSQIDGADVVLWAWSAPTPFFEMPCSDGGPAVAIHGLAICRYAKSGAIYRFSCNRDWEAENDSPWDTVEAAASGASGQYDVRSVRWHPL